jgi:tRNA G37 N-methylase Trm5
MRMRILTFVLVAVLALLPFVRRDQAHSQDKPTREPDVIYVPTPQEIVDKMLEMADVRPGEVVYDLGCGDGRIPVTAAKKYGSKAWGFDINPVRVKESLENVEKNNVKHLVTIKLQDIFELDLSKADVITLYLLPTLNVKLIPQLDKLKPGCRIVSHDFDMVGVRPKREATYPINAREHRIYLWETPLEKERKN